MLMLAHSHMVTHASLSPHHCPSTLRALLSFFFLVVTQRISTQFAIHENTEQKHQCNHRYACVPLPLCSKKDVCLLFSPTFEVSLCPPPPPAATPRLSGIFRGEQRQSVETKVTLHPEEASGAHQQVPEAVHLKTKYDVLTARTGPEQIQCDCVCFFSLWSCG